MNCFPFLSSFIYQIRFHSEHYRFLPLQEGLQVETGAHAIGPPELYVVGIMMRFFQETMSRVPCLNTVVHTGFHLGIHFYHPVGIPVNAPFPVYFHNATKLSIGRRIKSMIRCSDRQENPEILMSFPLWLSLNSVYLMFFPRWK